MTTITHGDFLSNGLPDASVDLIIADPPYFEVKGGFDYVWPSFDDYLKDVEKWAREFKRLLKPDGTLLYWGHALKIAYSQVILDRHFSILNSLVWEKKDPQTKKGAANYRCFAPVTERLLMYENQDATGMPATGLEEIHSRPECFASIKKFMREGRDALMLAKGFKTISQFNDFINELTGTNSVASRHYFADSQYCFPTKEHFEKMQTTGFWISRRYEDLRLEYEDLRLEYEDLRLEYEALRRPFNAQPHYQDVLRYSQESHISKGYNHPTQKPMQLTKELIKATTRPGALVFVPFAGSGTEVAAAASLGRRFIGFDIDKAYADMSRERAAEALKNGNQLTIL